MGGSRPGVVSKGHGFSQPALSLPKGAIKTGAKRRTLPAVGLSAAAGGASATHWSLKGRLPILIVLEIR